MSNQDCSIPNKKDHKRIFLLLNDGWSLGADDNQWIVYRKRSHRDQTKWQAVSFIASEKHILRRVLREKGIIVSPEANAALNALSDTFKEWLVSQKTS